MSFLDALGPIGIAAMALGTLGIIGGTIAQNNALKRENDAVQLQAKESQVAFQGKTLDSIYATNSLMADQVTAALGHGESAGSGSISAIVKSTYDNAKVTENNYQTESDVTQAAAKAKENAISDEEESSIFKGFAEMGSLAIEGMRA